MNEGTCDICHVDGQQVEHFSFYVNGSEGIWMCEACKIAVTKIIRHMRSVSRRAKFDGIKKSLGK